MWRRERWLAWINMEINTMKTKRTTSLVSRVGAMIVASFWAIKILVSLLSQRNFGIICCVCVCARARAQDVIAGWFTQQRWTGRKPCGTWTAVWFQLNGKIYAVSKFIRRCNAAIHSNLFLDKFWNKKLKHYSVMTAFIVKTIKASF